MLRWSRAVVSSVFVFYPSRPKNWPSMCRTWLRRWSPRRSFGAHPRLSSEQFARRTPTRGAMTTTCGVFWWFTSAIISQAEKCPFTLIVYVRGWSVFEMYSALNFKYTSTRGVPLKLRATSCSTWEFLVWSLRFVHKMGAIRAKNANNCCVFLLLWWLRQHFFFF